MQLVAQVHHLVVDSGSRASVAHVGVYLVGKVEHRGTLGEFPEFSLGREHEHLILIEVHLELVHHLQAVGVLQRGTDAVEPVVESALALHALVAPVGSQTFLCHLVHPFRADLHFHPFLFGAEYGDVEALIAVGFRNGQPVAQSFGIALVHIRDDGEGLPAL